MNEGPPPYYDTEGYNGYSTYDNRGAQGQNQGPPVMAPNNQSQRGSSNDPNWRTNQNPVMTPHQGNQDPAQTVGMVKQTVGTNPSKGETRRPEHSPNQQRRNQIPDAPSNPTGETRRPEHSPNQQRRNQIPDAPSNSTRQPRGARHNYDSRECNNRQERVNPNSDRAPQAARLSPSKNGNQNQKLETKNGKNATKSRNG